MIDTCGAKTRAGAPCKQKAIYSNGRCKFHGGLATGPTTDAGKEQSRINGRKGGRPPSAGVLSSESPILQGARLLSDVAISDASEKAEIKEHQGSPKVSPDAQVSARGSEHLPGRDLGRGVSTELQSPICPGSEAEKPKSWMSKETTFLPGCERCTMFASNGACLAIAKGLIASFPTGENCLAFSAF